MLDSTTCLFVHLYVVYTYIYFLITKQVATTNIKSFEMETNPRTKEKKIKKT